MDFGLSDHCVFLPMIGILALFRCFYPILSYYILFTFSSFDVFSVFFFLAAVGVVWLQAKRGCGEADTPAGQGVASMSAFLHYFYYFTLTVIFYFIFLFSYYLHFLLTFSRNRTYCQGERE